MYQVLHIINFEQILSFYVFLSVVSNNKSFLFGVFL